MGVHTSCTYPVGVMATGLVRDSAPLCKGSCLREVTEGLFLGSVTIPPVPFGTTSLYTREAKLERHGCARILRPAHTFSAQKSFFFQKNLDNGKRACYNILRFAAMAQSVEHIIGNDEVTSSILVSSSKSTRRPRVLFLRLRCRLTFDGNTAENLCFLPIYFPTRLCYNLNRTDFLFLSENNLLDTGEVTMRKHLCGLVIILLLCAALFALPAAAADVAKNERTGTLYDALDDALSEADSGDIITLLANAELLDIDDGGSYTYVPLTVEMNGHGISGMLTATDDLKLNNGWF